MRIGGNRSCCAVAVRLGCRGFALQKLQRGSKLGISTSISSACHGVDYSCYSDDVRFQFRCKSSFALISVFIIFLETLSPADSL